MKIVISNKYRGALFALVAFIFAFAALASHKYRSGEANDSAFAVLVFTAFAGFFSYKAYKEFEKIR